MKNSECKHIDCEEQKAALSKLWVCKKCRKVFVTKPEVIGGTNPFQEGYIRQPILSREDLKGVIKHLTEIIDKNNETIKCLKGTSDRNKIGFQKLEEEYDKAFETNKRINAENLELLKERDEFLKQIAFLEGKA